MDKTLKVKSLMYGRAELHKTPLKTYRIDVYSNNTWIRSYHAVTLSEAKFKFETIR